MLWAKLSLDNGHDFGVLNLALIIVLVLALQLRLPESSSSPSPQLFFPVINTRGRKQRSAEPEPLSQFASGRFLKQHSVLATLLGTNHKKSLVFGLFHKGNCSYRLSQCGLHGNIVVMKCLSKDINRFHFITIPFKILRHFTI